MEELTMAEKIKHLRIKRNMTLEEVASIVGVGKSTVRKWEVGMIENMRRDKIKALAEALGTTPEYLMGWDNKKEENKADLYTDEEKELVKLYRQLTSKQKSVVFEMMNQFRN